MATAPYDSPTTRAARRTHRVRRRVLIQLACLCVGGVLFWGVRALLPLAPGPVSLVVSNFDKRPRQVEVTQGQRTLARFELEAHAVQVLDDCRLQDQEPLVLHGVPAPADGWQRVQPEIRLIVVDSYPDHSVVRHVRAP